MNPISEAFKLAYQVSPIVLTNGIATLVGGYLPIVAITQGLNIGTLATLVDKGTLNQYFANFRPLPGSTLIDNQIAEFPFYTQQVAANAQIQQPLKVSLLMVSPAGNGTSFTNKLAVMTTLKSLLDVHNNQGGTYTVLTPSRIYTNCLLRQIMDVSTSETNQDQWAYQWDFVQPLLTFPGIEGIQSMLMSGFSNQSTMLPNPKGELTWSGLAQSAFPTVSGWFY